MGTELPWKLGQCDELRRYEPPREAISRLLTGLNAGTPAALTRSLRISQREAAWITPLNLILYFEHFRSFNRVESLTLSYFSCRIFDHVILGFLFRNLIPSVHRLRLHRPIACPTSLLRLISIFPNLRNTVIHAPHWEPIAQRDRHATARYHLHGELYLSDLDEESGPFISLLGSQRTEYERLTLERCGFRDFLPLQQLVSSAGMSLRNLYLFAEGNRKFDPLTSISGFLKTLTSTSRAQGSPENFAIRVHGLGITFHQCCGPRGIIPPNCLNV